MTSAPGGRSEADRQRRRDRGHRRPLVVVLAGPTAVGKSDVASLLCSPPLAPSISPRSYRGHVVSADSVQAYRGVDVGANKPTSEEMERTPHHLVNVVDPPADAGRAASYNAADWVRDARYVIRTLTSFEEDGGDGEGGEEGEMDADASLRRQAIDLALRSSLESPPGAAGGGPPSPSSEARVLPVVVGGTMMYLQWLVHGRPDAVRPSGGAIERAAAVIDGFRSGAKEAVGADDGGAPDANDAPNDAPSASEDATDAAAWEVASAHVSSLGPVFAARVGKLPGRDWYRLRRLLEVAYTVASQKLGAAAASGDDRDGSEESILQSLTEKEVYTGIRSGSLSDLGYDVRCFFLCPTDRMAHFHVVDERCEQMLLRGLLRETADLYSKGGLPDESQAARAIGYRQALEYLKRSNARGDDAGALASFVDAFATATRQYAKKQMQWFRRDGRFAFVPVDMGAEKPERAADAAGIIAGMCRLEPEAFEAELSTESNNDEEQGGEEGGSLPLSARTKLDNERQGKKMKFFISKRVRLIEGTDDFAKVLAEADECTRLVQGLSEGFLTK